MSWDQPAFSFGTPNAQPPTPTKTPTSAHLPSPLFQTPKNNHSSSFEDRSGWTPTFAEEYSVFNSTPGRLTSSHPSFADVNTPRLRTSSNQHRLSLSSEAGDIAAELATHVHHFSPNPNLPLPPVDPASRLPSSPGPYATRFDDPKKKVTPRRPKKRLEDPFTGQTATPPQTASKGTRRLAPKLSTDTMQNDQDGHFGTSQTPTHGPNMMDFPQSSADFFSYPLSAPATASAFSNAKPFWEPDHTLDGMDMDFNTDDANIFSTGGSHRIANSFDWGRNNQLFQDSVNNLERPVEVVKSNEPQKMKRQRPLAPKVDLSELLKNTPALPEFEFHDPARPRVQSLQHIEEAVDPANIWSRASMSMSMASPVESIPIPQSRPSTSHADLQPYSQQVRESLRDQEEAQQERMRARRKFERATASSPIRGLPRPGLQRSMSDNRGRRTQDRVVSRSGGRVSPLKRIAGLSSIPETAPGLRSDFEFVIDSNGRARMENVIVKDPPPSRYEDDDQSPYDSSSDDEATTMVPSRNTSFDLPQPKAPKFGRFEPSTRGIERRHSTHNSYSRSESSRSSQRSTRRGSLDSEAETVMEHDGTGDATQEIRKVMESRKQSQLKAQNSIQRRHPTDLRPRPRYVNYASSNISPSRLTDPDGATPSSTRSGTTRCVCGNPDSEGFMIQCESCDNWLHTDCIGIDQDSLPPVYICAFCAQTPIKRGGRLRDTARINNHAVGSSPLAHKTFHSFR